MNIKHLYHKWAFAVALTLCALLRPGSVLAQDGEADLIASGGSASGSYTKFLQQASTLCQSSVKVQVATSTGSSANLDSLERNETSIAIVQADALAYYGGKRDLSFVKTVAPLFQEQVYVIIRADYVKKVGGHCILGHCAGQTDFAPADFSQTNGMSLGAAGGAWVTANYIAARAGVKPNIVQDQGSGDDVVKKVLNHQYELGVLTGAAPLGTLVNLPADQKAQLRLLSIPASMMASLSPPYAGTTVTVVGTSQGGIPVPTVAVTAVLVTQNYTSDQPPAKFVSDFKKCLLSNAGAQASRVGTHPAWRGLKAGLSTTWPLWVDPYENVTSMPALTTKPNGRQPVRHTPSQG